MTNHGLLREARATLFVLVCLSLSVALHSWAHGHPPALVAVLAGVGLVIAVAMPLTGRRRGLPIITVGLAVTQAGLHGLFTLLPSDDAHVMMPTPTSGEMLTAHVLAVGLTALWLYAGEVTVSRLVRRLTRRVPALGVLFALSALRPLVPAPQRYRARLADLASPLPEPTWLCSVARRGPPRSLAVTS